MRVRAQISIFIIMMIMIIFLFIFLFSVAGDLEGEEIDSTSVSVDRDTSEIRFIRDNINSCLDEQLKRATILAGYRGGFIYDDGEDYSNSVILSDELMYSSDFLERINLNFNSLTQRTLLVHRESVYMPRLNSQLKIDTNGDNTLDTTIYDKSIRDDFEKFILDEFMRCVDLELYEEQGFEVEFEEYAGFILDQVIDDSTPNTPIMFLEVENLEGKVGDKVEVTLNGVTYLGVIEAELDEDGVTLTKFDEQLNVAGGNSEDITLPIYSEAEISDILVVNKDSEISVEVEFRDEEIYAKLYFPVLFRNQETEISVKKAEQTLPVRFSRLLKIVDGILNYKNLNRGVDLQDVDVINNIIQTTYLQESDHGELQYQLTYVENTDEYKRYILSFIDFGSKISAKPFIFNFAYENTAPEVDFRNTPFKEDSGVGKGTYYVVTPTIQPGENPLKYDLSKILEIQVTDRSRSFFRGQEIIDGDSIFTLSNDGQIEFSPFQQKRYSFPITVTDDETERTYTLVMLSGIPDNTNGKASQECYSFDTNDDPRLFPAVSDVHDRVLLYEPTNPDELKLAYAFTTHFPDPLPQSDEAPEIPLNSELLRGSIVEFRDSCKFDDGGFYNIKTKVIPLSSFDPYDQDESYSKQEITGFVTDSNGKFTISRTLTEPIVFMTNYFDQAGEALLDDYFILLVHPSLCLGPSEEMTSILPSGSTGSCCDMSKLSSKLPLDGPNSWNPTSFDNQMMDSDIMLKNGQKVIDDPFSFILDVRTGAIPSPLGDLPIDYRDVNIWDTVTSFGPSSLYKGQLQSVCGGKFPRWEHNDNKVINYIDGTSEIIEFVSKYFSASGVYIEGRDYPVSNFPIEAHEAIEGDICMFAFIQEDPLGTGEPVFKFPLSISGLPFLAYLDKNVEYTSGGLGAKPDGGGGAYQVLCGSPNPHDYFASINNGVGQSVLIPPPLGFGDLVQTGKLICNPNALNGGVCDTVNPESSVTHDVCKAVTGFNRVTGAISIDDRDGEICGNYHWDMTSNECLSRRCGVNNQYVCNIDRTSPVDGVDTQGQCNDLNLASIII